MSIKSALVTGGAGFIGSNLVDLLLSNGISVRVIDNLSTGRVEFLTNAQKNPNFQILEADLVADSIPDSLFAGVDVVFHLAANADVRFGPLNTSRDLEQNTIATQRVLELARRNQVKKFVFSSTGSVYGESEVVPTPENAPFPVQTSLYGASKLAGEGLVSAYAEAFDMQTWIFRFVSILGPRYTHGHVFDFISQLRIDPNTLRVLGNGQQKKSYLHVKDCLSAIMLGLSAGNSKVNIYNLGIDGTCEVKDSIYWITTQLGLQPTINFGTESRGWIGDNPLIHLDVKKISNLGWKPSHTIEESVKDTVRFLQDNTYLFEKAPND
jgi:UDP-glucose 4-epimerase